MPRRRESTSRAWAPRIQGELVSYSFSLRGKLRWFCVNLEGGIPHPLEWMSNWCQLPQTSTGGRRRLQWDEGPTEMDPTWYRSSLDYFDVAAQCTDSPYLISWPRAPIAPDGSSLAAIACETNWRLHRYPTIIFYKKTFGLPPHCSTMTFVHFRSLKKTVPIWLQNSGDE